jgi:hypothetical protein
MSRPLRSGRAGGHTGAGALARNRAPSMMVIHHLLLAGAIALLVGGGARIACQLSPLPLERVVAER